MGGRSIDNKPAVSVGAMAQYAEIEVGASDFTMERGKSEKIPDNCAITERLIGLDSYGSVAGEESERNIWARISWLSNESTFGKSRRITLETNGLSYFLVRFRNEN